VAGLDSAGGLLLPSFHAVERAGEFHRGAADGADIDSVRGSLLFGAWLPGMSVVFNNAAWFYMKS